MRNICAVVVLVCVGWSAQAQQPGPVRAVAVTPLHACVFLPAALRRVSGSARLGTPQRAGAAAGLAHSVQITNSVALLGLLPQLNVYDTCVSNQ